MPISAFAVKLQLDYRPARGQPCRAVHHWLHSVEAAARPCAGPAVEAAARSCPVVEAAARSCQVAEAAVRPWLWSTYSCPEEAMIHPSHYVYEVDRHVADRLALASTTVAA